MKSFIRVFLLLFVSILLFSTCDNPIGLGTKVNTEKPVIKTSGNENKPGAFFQGNGDNEENSNRIWLDIEQEFGIDDVYMEVDYVDSVTGETKTKKIQATMDPASKKWYVDLDTTGMADGQIKTRVTAIDVDGNKTTTTDIVYFVKNSLPQIKLNMPGVSENQFDDDAFLNNLINTDPLYMGFELLGLATDNYGIAEGYPKILIWPADPDEFNDIDEDGLPKDTNEYYGTWRSLVVPNDKRKGKENIITATKFSWPMLRLHQDAEAPGGWRLPKDNEQKNNLKVGKYRIRIVTKDLFENYNYYPNRDDHGASKASKKYIEINYLASDIPIIQVTDSPQYYNGAKDFVVDFLVSSQNRLHPTDPIEAYIVANINEAEERIIGGPYKPEFQLPDKGSPYRYILTVTVDDVKKWNNPQEGTMAIRLKAKDDSDKSGPYAYQNFNYDITPPEVVIDRPVVLTNPRTGSLVGGTYSIYYPSETPKWVTATISVGGTPSDKSNIKGIYYHVGKLGDDFNSQTFWNDHYDNDAVLNGEKIWADTRLNTTTPVSPWSGSSYAWTYTVNYPIGYKFSHSDLVQELGELDSYSGTNSETDGRERFYLPLYVKIVDNAENFHIVHYKLCVDPLLDEPQVSIIYPKRNDTVGGTVRVTGTAEDNYWMHTVLMRIHKDGDVDFKSDTESTSYWYIPTTVPPTELFYPDLSYPAPISGGNRDEAGWFKLALVGDGTSVNWTSTVNGDGKLNPNGGAETVDVTFEVVAIDTDEPTHTRPHIVGPVTKLTAKFSSKVPRIEDIKIIKDTDSRDYVEGISSSGKFVVSMKISALEGINKVLAKVNNDSQVTLMTSNTALQNNSGVWFITPPTINNENRYEATLTMTVDSTAVNSIVSGIGYGKTGVMNLEISVEDATAQNFSATNSFRVGIDNFYPIIETIETSTMAYDNIAVKKYFLVQGTAKDWGDGSGSLQGLERVLVYFEEAVITYTKGAPDWTGRKVVGNQKMRKPDGTDATTLDFVEYPVMDTTKPLLSNPAEPNAKTGFVIPKLAYNESIKAWTSTAAMVIDYGENDPEKDYDHDGTYGEKWIGLTDKTWEARMLISNPTTGATNFKDGPYIVHYIVMDTAGNATHYQKDIYIENNKPRITQINIGTDIDFDGDVDEWQSQSNPGEYRDQAYDINNTSESRGTLVVPDKDFRIRNYQFGIRLTRENGNGAKTAKVTYVTKGAAITVDKMERGRVYQIASTDVTTDFTKYGAPNGYTDTVFVAASEGEGKGTVYKFDEVISQSLSLGTGTASESVSNVYENFKINNIPVIDDNPEGLFIMKVYDTTVASTLQYPVNPEYDQLAQAVLLTVSVNNIDTIPPKIDVANFGRRHITSATGTASNYDDNVLSTVANAVYTDYIDTDKDAETGDVITKKGYVQYQAHSTPNTTAYISGKVIFYGKVNDNHRIKKITVQIPGYNGDTEFSIAERNNSTLQLESASTNISGEREFKIVYPEVPQYHLAYGHTLVWQFMWDSSKIDTVTKSNVNITFKVYDESSTTDTAPSSIKNVNIVPYISEVVTSLSKAFSSSPSVFNRSALGGYPVQKGEVITLKGFNLGTSDVKIGNIPLNFEGNNTDVNDLGYGGLKFTVHNDAVSGPLVVTVSNIPSFNNNNTDKNKSVAYNKEPNNVNNNTLDNSRYMYVWNTGALISNITYVSNPFMRIAPNGTRLISYGYYNGTETGRLRVQKDNTDVTLGASRTNRMINTTVAVGGTNTFYAAGSDLSSNTNQGFQFTRSNNTGGGYSASNAANQQYLLSNYSGIKLIDMATSGNDRFKIPRIVVQPTNMTSRTNTNADRILMGFFDDNKKEVRIIYSNIGENTVGNMAAGSADNNGSNAADTTSSELVANASSTFNGGMYTAVGLLSNGLPVIAWYDATAQNLIFSYGGNTTDPNNPLTAALTNDTNAGSRVATSTNTTTGRWQTNAVIIDSGKGTHVDMAIDGNSNIHLAYYSNSGGLYYAYIPVTGTGTSLRPNITKNGNMATNITPVRVDTYLSAGTKVMINIRNNIPYISYAHASFPGTKQSVRVAWKVASSNTAHSTNTDNTFTGNWEVMTVPVSGIPNTNEFVCNGVPTSATWTNPSSSLTYDHLDKTIIVGYLTDLNYEGAILKDDITSVPDILRK